ncbi:MAG: peptidylprolyl isomerase [Spirochaetales bacterium]|nr:peptidylprolyl isomerase [Spirochaetales bacterium]
MKVEYFLSIVFIVLMSCTAGKECSPFLSTDAFDYTGNIFIFAKNMEKKSKLFSFENEVPLVNTTKFSITNKYVLPFLYYQVSADSLDFSTVSKDRIDELFYFMAYSLAQKELYYQEIAASDFVYDEDEVNKQIEAYIGDVEQFKMYLKDSPLSYSFIAEDLKKNVIIEKYRNEKISYNAVDDEEVLAYYNTNPSISKINPSLQVRHIFVGFSPNFNKHKSFAKIKRAKNELTAGQDFAAAAKKYSEDKISAKNGGFFPDFITRGSLQNEKLERAAFGLKKGEVSEIIETVVGYELLKVEEINDEGEIAFGEMAEHIRKLIEYEAKRNAIDAENARIEQKYELEFVHK